MYSIACFVSVTDMNTVYCAVQTVSLNQTSRVVLRGQMSTFNITVVCIAFFYGSASSVKFVELNVDVIYMTA